MCSVFNVVVFDEFEMDKVDRVSEGEIIPRDLPEKLARCRGRWTMDEIDRMLRGGFDVPSNMTYDIACSICDSLDIADGVRCKVDVHASSEGPKNDDTEISDISICVGEAAEEVKTVKKDKEHVERAKKRVTFMDERPGWRGKTNYTASNNMDDVDKIIRVMDMEAECERPYRSFFYQLVVLTVLILALTVAVAVYTVYEFRHLYPNLGDHTAPINITVWRNTLNN